jgi:hypothetical protein
MTDSTSTFTADNILSNPGGNNMMVPHHEPGVVARGDNMILSIPSNGNGNNNHFPPPRLPTPEELAAVFQMCRSNQWNSVLNSVRNNPQLAKTSMTMDNHITTTIIHQAITSKGSIKPRARVIEEILTICPDAAMIKNGYGSLPLHVIAQRNTKIDAATKESLIKRLVSAYPGAMTQQGGVGMRTPLHIIFTDYISPRLTAALIRQGPQACFMKDRKGYLPAHVACSRHCSPEKLQMLLEVNPTSLFDRTNDGDTLLSLATKTATKSHPNYALIDDLQRRLHLAGITEDHAVPNRVSSNDTTDTFSNSEGSPANRSNGSNSLVSTTRVSRRRAPVTSRSRKRRRTANADHHQPNIKVEEDTEQQANLLLHFSRQTNTTDLQIKNFASV